MDNWSSHISVEDYWLLVPTALELLARLGRFVNDLERLGHHDIRTRSRLIGSSTACRQTRANEVGQQTTPPRHRCHLSGYCNRETCHTALSL
jgi:hypothetical protein